MTSYGRLCTHSDGCIFTPLFTLKDLDLLFSILNLLVAFFFFSLLKTTENYSLTVLEAKSSEIKVSEGAC